MVCVLVSVFKPSHPDLKENLIHPFKVMIRYTVCNQQFYTSYKLKNYKSTKGWQLVNVDSHRLSFALPTQLFILQPDQYIGWLRSLSNIGQAKIYQCLGIIYNYQISSKVHCFSAQTSCFNCKTSCLRYISLSQVFTNHIYEIIAKIWVYIGRYIYINMFCSLSIGKGRVRLYFKLCYLTFWHKVLSSSFSHVWTKTSGTNNRHTHKTMKQEYNLHVDEHKKGINAFLY